MDLGFVEIARTHGKRSAYLNVYRDSFSDPVRVKMGREDIERLLADVRQAWYPGRTAQGESA